MEQSGLPARPGVYLSLQAEPRPERLTSETSSCGARAEASSRPAEAIPLGTSALEAARASDDLDLEIVADVLSVDAVQITPGADVIIDHWGGDRPLSGRTPGTRTDRRYFTPAQVRAMIARDGDRCIWPWCDRPVAWSDGHHLQHWARGGPTTVANGALPCTAHHTALHEGGWTATREPDGRYTMRHRDGRTIGPEPHPPGHNRPPPHRRE